jgi:uncharacterized membrane protein
MKVATSIFSRGTKLVGAAGLIVLGASSPALADWSFCNHTPEKAFVAISFDNGGGYISTGWKVVPGCGGCVKAYEGMPNNRGAFFSAHTLNGSAVWKGDNLFCVGMNDFTFKRENSSSGACKSRGGHMDGFIPTNLTSNNFTTNLNGSIPGKVCQSW